jgi:hypothetical protein
MVPNIIGIMIYLIEGAILLRIPDKFININIYFGSIFIQETVIMHSSIHKISLRLQLKKILLLFLVKFIFD